MSNVQISRYKIADLGNRLHIRAKSNYLIGEEESVQTRLGTSRIDVNGIQFNAKRVRNLAVPGILYASVVALSGCATSLELESLRAEVVAAHAAADRAEANVASMQRQLNALKASSESPKALSKPKIPATATSQNASGYKWEEARQTAGNR